MEIIQHLGVDYHPYQQTVAFIDKNGEVQTRRFYHTEKATLRKFYQQYPAGTVVGVEATGAMKWFEEMLFEIKLELCLGNPRRIRQMAPSPHKNDVRDAKHILDLLLSERFPAIKKRSGQSQVILGWLNYRQSLVKSRTAIANQLQSMARNCGLARFGMKGKFAKEKFNLSQRTREEIFLLESRFAILEKLSGEIKAVEAKLKEAGAKDKSVQLLLSHPGIGVLSALCLVHTLGDVNRFAKKEQVVGFVGLSPLDDSSGETRRIGHISKHGSRLWRYLLGQSALRSNDPRLRSFYLQVSRRRGQAKAKVAAARKLLERSYLMLRDKLDYEEFRRRGEVGLPDCPRKES